MKSIAQVFYVCLVARLVQSEDVHTSGGTSGQFITLSADCSQHDHNGTIELILHTSEPFYGSLYSRDHASTCKRVGEGGVATKLIVTRGKECGVQAVPQRAGKLVSANSKKVCY